MKILKYSTLIGLFAVVLLASCKDFQEVNKDPNAVDEDRVRIEFLLNKSIYDAQMDPHIAERVFILSWDRIAKYEQAGGLAMMSANDQWIADYWTSYGFQWVKNANLAVTIGDKRLAEATVLPQLINVVQMARIWRAYLFAELADNFGPIPRSKAFLGSDLGLTFDNVEDVYKFILAELADASAKLDFTLPAISDLKNYDQVFAGDLKKWQKYANSMRLRYAMRLSNVDPAYARAQFELAVNLPLIETLEDIASVQENGGWGPTTGVMTRGNNWQHVSMTMNNISFGLGGVNVSDLTTVKGLAVTGLPAAEIATYAKDPNTYLGLYMPSHLSDKTNVESSPYFFDAIPKVADPRLFKNYSLPGYNDGVVSKFPISTEVLASTATIQKMKDNPDAKIKLRTQYSWIGLGFGEWAEKSALFSGFISKNANFPCKSKRWCDNERKRVFFAPWETQFLLAEAALYGWNTNGVSDKVAYEKGVEISMAYLEIPTGIVNNYLSSESYNRLGTSASYDHTAEPVAPTMQYVDITTNLEASGETNIEVVKQNPTLTTKTYNYPKGFYATNNDKLTKIITQKYIAQCPWLPLEAWSDYRRLGLPFQENPYLEKSIVTMPDYTDYSVASLNNIPGRMPYPQSISINNKTGYESGVAALGGKDEVKTPLWWAKKN